MNDVRKVVGDLIEWARHAMRQDRPEDPMDVIENAKQFLASLPAAGEAWYPGRQDIYNRLNLEIGAPCEPSVEQVIRATADLIRERGGQVGGEVVAWQYQHKSLYGGDWSPWYPCSKDRYDAIVSSATTRPECRARELIARQPAAQVAQEAPGRVVAWRYVLPDASVGHWIDGEPCEVAYRIYGRPDKGWKIELAYSEPPQSAGAPADVVAAAEQVAEGTYQYGSQFADRAAHVLRYLQSLQGAGHEG